MIKPGWKRDTCPQCHMPGRIGETFDKALKNEAAAKAHSVRLAGMLIGKLPPITSLPSFIMISITGPTSLPWTLLADFCSNCGVQYIYECQQYAAPLDPAVTNADVGRGPDAPTS